MSRRSWVLVGLLAAVVVLAGFRSAPRAHRYLVTAGNARTGLAVEILARTGRVVRVVVRGTAFAKWSPDGSMIAWADRSGISVERTGGGGRRLLVPAADACMGGCTSASFAWSPNGRSLAIGGGGTKTNRILVVALGSGRRILLAPVRRDTSYDVLGWTPDGRAIVYQRFQGHAGFGCCHRDLRIAASDGSRTRVVHVYPYQQGSAPSLSPDGRSVAALYSKGRGFVVRILDLRSGEEHAIAGVESSLWRPAWSPDSRRIAFAGTGGNAVTVSASGGGVRRLGPAGLVVVTRTGGLLIVRGATRDTLGQVWKSSGGGPARMLFRLPEGDGLVTIDER